MLVLNAADEPVRRFSGGELNNTTSSELVWGGLDDLGRVVIDGRYRLQVLGSDSTVLGEAIVIVDNNRSSLLGALGTPFGSFTNLSCQIGDISSFELSKDEQSIVFAIRANEAHEWLWARYISYGGQWL